MRWAFKNKWFLLGAVISLIVGYAMMASLFNFTASHGTRVLDIKDLATTFAIRLTAIRIVVVTSLFTVAYPVINGLIIAITRNNEYALYIARFRYRILIWYWIMEAVSALSHIG